VLTHTFKFVVEEKSFFVSEYARQNEVFNYATAQSVSLADEMLRSRKAYDELKRLSDIEMKSLLIALAQPLGLGLTEENIRIESSDEVKVDKGPWVPDFSQGGQPSAETIERLRSAGCTFLD
jgi:hypothetical protein